MNNIVKRFLSLALALVMVIGMAPQITIGASAVSGGTVYFTNNKNWETVNAYIWNDSDSLNGNWPGEAMTYVGTNDYGQDIYFVELPDGATKIIFNNGSEQTVDIALADNSENAYYLAEKVEEKWTVGTWLYTPSTGDSGEGEEVTPPEGGSEGDGEETPSEGDGEETPSEGDGDEGGSEGEETSITTIAQLQAAIDAAAEGETITVSQILNVAEGETVELDLKGKTVNLVSIYNSGNLTVKNGTLVGTSAEESVIETSAGSLTLENVNASGPRHVIRVKGGEVTISSGTYKVLGTAGMTTHAVNVSGGTVTINGGTFVGPEGTGGDSGTTVLAQGGTVIINGGNFSGASAGYGNEPVTATNGGIITIYGGTYDSDPSNYVAEDYEVKHIDGVYKVVPIVCVAKIGETKYKTLAEALDAVQVGETITLIADVTEDVTVTKNLTIDGSSFKYTGNISVSGSAVDITVKNVNFENGTGYAVTTNRIKSVTIENCTVKNYGYGFLYANKSTPTVVVKNVTVDGGNYGMHWVYGTTATLENVTMTNVTNGLYIQNYAGKTINLKNCDISSIEIWERDGYSGVQTFKFEGKNTVGTLSTSQYAKYVLAAADATLTAPDGATVTTDVAGYGVKHIDGAYKVVPIVPVAQIGNVEYQTLAAAIEAAKDGDTIKLISDIDIADAAIDTMGNEGDNYSSYFVVAGKTITIDLNGKTIGGTYTGEDMLVGVFSTEDNGHLTLTNGTVDIKATVTDGNSNVYALVVSYELDSSITIENGTYTLDAAIDNLIYAQTNEGVVINGGTFTLGNVGNGQNGKPWIINVKGQNEGHVIVNGGTFNADISHQFWANEVYVPETKGLEKTGENIWTIKDAVAYVEEMGTSNNSTARKVGYVTLTEALDAVQDGETITLLDVEGSESKEIDFTKDISFTITGNAPSYALPTVTFQNATVTIKDAEILIPELDARQNATINVVDSIVHDAGGDSIVKSYYNGAINISGTSKVYTMQVTTMGYITVSDTAELSATWQTNVYGNGLITVKDDATYATAALHLTGQDYSDRDNTDAERVGKPATIVVDGATFTVGKVYSDNGADYSYNSSKGINIGTVDGKYAVLDIKNGATVNIYTANGETANIGANGTLALSADSSLTATTIAGNGKIIIDAAGMTAGKVTTITADASGFTGTIEVINNDKLEASIVDGSIVLTEKAVSSATIGHGLQTIVNESKPRESVTFTAEDVYAEKELKVELWSGETKLSTTTLREIDLDDETAELYPAKGNRTVNIVVSGKESGSWETTWHVTPTIYNVPDTIKVYVDGSDEPADTYTKEGGVFLNDTEKEEYLALVGVKKPYIESAYVGDQDDRESIKVDMYYVYAEDELKVELYSGETLMATATLNQYDADDTEKTNPYYPANGTYTANMVIWGREAGSWTTEWKVDPTIDLAPTKVVVYTDGNKAAEKDIDLGDAYKNLNAVYVNQIKADLLEGKNVTLDRDITVTYDHVDSVDCTANGNGQYKNWGIFTVISGDVTFDLNGYNITFDDHSEDFCNKAAFALFYANNGGKLTVVGNGNVTVNGMATGAYSTCVGSELTIKGGNWVNNPCKDCGATNIFLYASHGGELYIEDGTFDQKADPSYLIVEHTGYVSNESALVDYSKTKVEITGGTFVGMNPEEAHSCNQTDWNKQEWGTTNVCADGYKAVENEDGSWTVKEAVYVAQVGETKYESLQDAINACTNGETVQLIADITYGADDIVCAHGGATGFGNYDQYNPSIIYIGGTRVDGVNSPSTVNAVLDLNGHTITNYADAYTFLIMDNAKLTFTGIGSITNTAEAPVIWVTGTDTLVTIESGNYTTGNDEGLLWSTHGGDLVINGGEFRTTAEDASLLIIRNEKDRKNTDYFINGKATITITGGTFHGFNPENTPDDSTDPYTYFNAVAEGYAAVETDENVWTVKEAVYVAQIDEIKYTTLEAAVKAANATSGAVIELLADVTLSGGFEENTEAGLYIASSVTINGNGHTITYTGSDAAIELACQDSKISNLTINVAGAKAGTAAIEYTNGNSDGFSVVDVDIQAGENIAFRFENNVVFEASDGTIDAATLIESSAANVTVKIGNKAITGDAKIYVKSGSLTLAELFDNFSLKTKLIEVSAGATLDLNGVDVTAEGVAAFGNLIDSTDGTGSITIDEDKLVYNMHANSNYLPLYDSKNECYRIYATTVTTRGVKVVNADTLKYGYTIYFNNADAYLLLAEMAESNHFSVNTVWTDEGTGVKYEFTAGLLRSFASKAYEQLNGGKVTTSMTINVKGISTLASGTVVSATPTLTADVDVTISGEPKDYTIN